VSILDKPSGVTGASGAPMPLLPYAEQVKLRVFARCAAVKAAAALVTQQDGDPDPWTTQSIAERLEQWILRDEDE
jgi:hypothetical protein